MNQSPAIYVSCPDKDTPSGGIRKLYQHVDVLNKHGFRSYIVHQQEGFRCTWFHSDTPVVYQARVEPEINPSDYLVIPEYYGPDICDYRPGIRKVILNQGAHLTFTGYPLDKHSLKTPYRHPDVVATLVVSQHSHDYLRYIFPELPLFRIHNGINTDLFKFSADKKRQIAFMPRRLPQDINQVINMLKFRGALEDFELVPIHDVTEPEVAAILQESLIFLSFSDREGCGLPPQEAMACGCIVIGYHGNGGKEFFDESFCYPVEATDTIAFSRTVEAVIGEYRQNHASLREKAKRGAEFIMNTYFPEREAADIIGCWKSICAFDEQRVDRAATAS